MYLGKTITITLEGRTTHEVVCEKCKQVYAYEFSRTAAGDAFIPLGVLFRLQAEAKAKARAINNLAYKLKNESEMVSCPHCHWINQQLVANYRLGIMPKAGQEAFFAASAFGCLTAIFAFIWYLSPDAFSPVVLMYTTLVGLMVTLLVPMTIFWVRHLKRQRLDPNRDFPQPPILPTGTPPALLTRRNSTTGTTEYYPAPVKESVVLGSQLGHVLIRKPLLVKETLPPYCSLCMAPTEVNKIWEDAATQTTFLLPVCKTCAAQLQKKKRLLALYFYVVTFGLMVWIFPELLPFGYFKVGVLCLVALILPWACADYLAKRKIRRCKCIDNERGVYRITPFNPRYTYLLDRSIKQAEGVVPRDNISAIA